MLKMRNVGISLASMVLTAGVVFNAYYQKKQFYPSVVYITKSNASMAVIYLQSLVLVLMLGKLMRKVFLGQLRPAEFEHLMERFWYALTETCLAFTVFRDDFNPRFVALFTVLLFLKSFHWLAEERVNFMEQSPTINWIFHVRVASLLTVLGILDYSLISYAYYSTVVKGATVQLVFGFEYAVLITIVANAAIKYVLHLGELRVRTQWENKAVFLLYAELVIGFVRVVLYVIFVVLMVKIYTLPLFAFRPMYYTMRNFKKALNDIILSRRAIRDMNTLYPDATPEELAGPDNICIICRENMVNSSKKLPCGHIFHTFCLRSWFQRQQTCPTCRFEILRAPSTATNQPRPINQPAQAAPPIGNVAAAAAAAAAANNNNIINNNNNINNNAPPLINNMFANLLPPPQTVAGAGPVNLGTNTAVPLAPGSLLLPPPFPFMAPYAVAIPPMPPNLDQLTEDELRAMEGNERRHVEERIKLLRNVQLLLDSATALMNQYTAITAHLPPPPPPPPPSVLTTNTNETSGSSVSLPTEKKSQQEKDETTTVLPSTSKSTLDSVKLEDVGSEDYVDIGNADNKGDTSKLSTHIEHVEDPSDPIVELRRRRLQKFLQTEANGQAPKNPTSSSPSSSS